MDFSGMYSLQFRMQRDTSEVILLKFDAVRSKVCRRHCAEWCGIWTSQFLSMTRTSQTNEGGVFGRFSRKRCWGMGMLRCSVYTLVHFSLLAVLLDSLTYVYWVFALYLSCLRLAVLVGLGLVNLALIKRLTMLWSF